MVAKEHVSVFDIKLNAKPNMSEASLTQKIILPWAHKLADTLPTHTILDLGAGQGIESCALAEIGFQVVSQDVSDQMLAASYYDGPKVTGVAEQLPYRDQSFAGILLKDTLVFLSPDSRDEMLEEAKRVLVTGGGMLVVSESTYMRVWKQDKPNTLAYKDTYPTNDNWQALHADARSAYDHEFVFAASAADFSRQALSHGFTAEVKSNHTFESLYYKEKRWGGGTGGFVVELTKK